MRNAPVVVAIGIASVGAAARLIHYAGNRSFWTDEAALVVNLVSRTAGQLVDHPLAEGQVASAGFLWIERAAVVGLGSSEYALRLFPLVASLIALALFGLLSQRVLGGLSQTAMVVAVGLIATARPLIYYAAEVKQYASDVAVAVALLLAAIPVMRGDYTPRRVAILAVLGCAAPWLSQPSIFVLGAIGVCLIWRSAATHGAVRRAMAVSFLWLVSALSMVLLAAHALAPADRAYLDAYWAAGFLPVPPHSLHDLLWLPRLMRDLFAQALPTPLPALATLVAAIGVVALWRTAPHVGLLLVLPLVFALIASAFHLYPISGRLALFLVPTLALALAAGVGAADRWRRPAGWALAAVLLVPPLWAMPHDALFHREELRPVMQTLAARRRPGDTIYVYYATEPAFRVYAARTGVPLSGAVIGSCARDDWRRYVSELDRLRGRGRVWVVASHLYRGQVDEDSLITQYLRVIGRGTPMAAVATLDAWARLYDLSDTTSATTRAAAAFRPALTDRPPAAPYSCGPPA